MSRKPFITIVAALAVPTLGRADPAPHATGGWVELALDSNLLIASNSYTLDAPSQRLAFGGQLADVAVGLETGFAHPPGSQLTRLDIGPTARFTIVATPTRQTELVLEAGVLASIGFTTKDMGDGGPTLYTFMAGLEARHWIDPHFAIGGGLLAHLATQSQGMASELDLGLGGAVRVTGVF